MLAGLGAGLARALVAAAGTLLVWRLFWRISGWICLQGSPQLQPALQLLQVLAATRLITPSQGFLADTCVAKNKKGFWMRTVARSNSTDARAQFRMAVQVTNLERRHLPQGSMAHAVGAVKSCSWSCSGSRCFKSSKRATRRARKIVFLPNSRLLSNLAAQTVQKREQKKSLASRYVPCCNSKRHDANLMFLPRQCGGACLLQLVLGMRRHLAPQPLELLGNVSHDEDSALAAPRMQPAHYELSGSDFNVPTW